MKFMRARILSLLEEQGIDPDLGQAVAGESVPIERVLVHPLGVEQRAALLGDWRQNRNDAFQKVQEVVQRAARLADHAMVKDPAAINPNRRELIEPGLFEKKSEKVLHTALQGLYDRVLGKYSPGKFAHTREYHPSQDLLDLQTPAQVVDTGAALYSAFESIDLLNMATSLSEMSQALSCFFDGDESVMVMCEDQDVRANRLNMLLVIKNMASLLADFTKIQNRRISS
jgi:glycyl-tRNA synthetase beta chain